MGGRRHMDRASKSGRGKLRPTPVYFFFADIKNPVAMRLDTRLNMANVAYFLCDIGGMRISATYGDCGGSVVGRCRGN
jgi:hypothetical protein